MVNISTSGKLTIPKDIVEQSIIWVEVCPKDFSHYFVQIPVIVSPKAVNVHLRADFGDGIMKYVSNTTKTWDVTDSMTLELSSLVYPFDAGQDVNWTVSNKNIATVEDREDGTAALTFTGSKFGKLTVTGTAADGSKVKTSFTLNVIRTVQNMELPRAMVATGGKTVKLAGQLTFDPVPTVKEITWSMQMAEFAEDDSYTMVEVPADIATLDAKGNLKVSKKLADYAYLIVTARDEITGVTAESYITLCPKAMTGIVVKDLDGNTIKSGSTVKVENANAYPFTIEAKNNTDKTYYDCVGWRFAFSGDTSNYDIATVGIMETEDGETLPAVIQQTEAGKVKVTIKALDDSKKTFSFYVNFLSAPASES